MMLHKQINIIAALVLYFSAGFFWTASSEATTPKQMYIRAEGCYKQLRHSRQKMKYRHN
jgi:hypothetical protein